MSNLEIAIRIVERQKYISSKALCTALGDEGIRVDGKELKNELIRVSHDKNSPIGAIGNDGADAFLNPDVFYSRKWFLQYGTSGRPVERDEAANHECGSTLLDRPEASSRSFSMGRYTENSRRCPLALGGAVLVNYAPEGADYG